MQNERAGIGQRYVSNSESESTNIFHQYSASTFKMYCAKYGDHSTEQQRNRCWNGDAIVTMRDDMLGLWDKFTEDINSYLEISRYTIQSTFKRILDVTCGRGEPNSYHTFMEANICGDVQKSLRTLTRTLYHHRVLLIREIEDHTINFNNQMFETRTDALFSMRTSIIGQLMEPYYKAAIEEHGI